MKPHFYPGDQVITKDKQVGDILSSHHTPIGNWFYTVNLPYGVQAYHERELWHVNDTVARERAYARKGKVVPSDHGAPEDDATTDPQRGL